MALRVAVVGGNIYLRPASRRRGIYPQVARLADVMSVTESQYDRAAIRTLPGFGTAFLGGLALAWRRDRLRLVASGGRRVMVGGRRGAGKSRRDRRRRGPDRFVLWVLLADSTGQQWLVFFHHAIAKADSMAWRRPLRAQGFAGVAAEVTRVTRLYPAARVLMLGDWNTRGPVSFGNGLTEVKTPPTFGRRAPKRGVRLDRIKRSADVAVSGVTTLRTASDHRALLAVVAPAGKRVPPTPPPVSKPKPAPVKPKSAPKPAPKPEVPHVTQRLLPKNLPELLRAEGLRVAPIPGFETRGRPPSKGPFHPVGVDWHHTGGDGDGVKYAQWLAKIGRPDLAAPLAHVSIGRDGTVYVLALGRANHAGKARPSGPVAGGDGNALYVGVECHNTGSEGWSKAQYNAMVTTGVVLGRVLGCSPDAQRAHRETSVTGKWDPGKLDMTRFRADIAAKSKAASAAPAAEVTPYDQAYALGEQIGVLGRRVKKNYAARRRFIDGVAALVKDAPVPESRRKAKR